MAICAPSGVSTEEIYRFNNVKVDNDRWSAFLDASFTLLIGSLVAEVGWMQGSDPIEGFSLEPGGGSHIEVHTVLRLFALRHPLEEQSRPVAFRIEQR